MDTQTGPTVKLRVFCNADITPACFDDICRSIACVWDHHVGTKVTFQVVITDRVLKVDGDGETEDETPTAYYPRLRLFVFSMDQVRDFQKRRRIDFESALLLAAAHEARHAVHDHEGLLPSTAEEEAEYRREYRQHTIEQQAWEASLEVLKAVFPNATGEIDTGDGVVLEVPSSTPYREAWIGARFDVEIVDAPPMGMKEWDAASNAAA